MALHSVAKSSIAIVVSYTKSLNDASKLCFGAAAGCFVVGMFGWIVNFFAAETTMLDGLLVVSAFYFALGVIKLFEKRVGYPDDIDPACDFNDQILSPEKDVQPEEKRLDPAA